MPGISNTPQATVFETINHPAVGVSTKVNWFRAEGIPISPFDDAYLKNPYPLMRIIARNGGGAPIATNDIVLPVSD
ncbi:MAG: cytochrome C, partial [Verrucomicrobiales bacterium]